MYKAGDIIEVCTNCTLYLYHTVLHTPRLYCCTPVLAQQVDGLLHLIMVGLVGIAGFFLREKGRGFYQMSE